MSKPRLRTRAQASISRVAPSPTRAAPIRYRGSENMSRTGSCGPRLAHASDPGAYRLSGHTLPGNCSMRKVATLSRLVFGHGVLLLGGAACSTSRETTPAPAAGPATLIVGASVLDGTGAEPIAASVRIWGDRIEAVGTLSPRDDDR